MLSSGAAASVSLNYHDLDNILSQPETEHNWAQKETAIKSIGAACHVSIGHNQEYVAFIKSHRKAFSDSVSPPLFQINNSEQPALATRVCCGSLALTTTRFYFGFMQNMLIPI